MWLRPLHLAGALLPAVVLAGCGDADPDVDAELARGAELYQMHCVACHGGATGGDISDIPPRHNAEGHTWHHADCELVDIVLDGLPRREGYPEMPAFGQRLSEAEVEAILSHIKSWWKEDQREFQAEVTEQLCNDEHGAQAVHHPLPGRTRV